MPAGLSDVSFGGYRPGAPAEVIRLHMAYYGRDWGFGRPFEAKLAAELGEFLARFDPERDLFLCADRPAGTLIGSITVDAESASARGAHLRWYIVSDEARGSGLGAHTSRARPGPLRGTALRPPLSHHLRRPGRRAPPL